MRAVLVPPSGYHTVCRFRERPSVARPCGRQKQCYKSRNLRRRIVTIFVSSSASDVPHPESPTPFRLPDPLGLRDVIETNAPANAKTVPTDLLPVPRHQRSWTAYDLCGLWIGLVVCIPAWRFAASFATLGATIGQAASCVFLANLLITFPMIASAQMGTKYGAPFPVLIRSAFGVTGAKFPSLLRALVGCGWFGIQTFVGGCAVRSLFGGVLGSGSIGTAMNITWDSWSTYGVGANSLVATYVDGASPIDLLCYLLFLCLQLFVVHKGVESVKTAERFAAPVLVVLTIGMLVWAVQVGGGWGAVLASGGTVTGATSSIASASNSFMSTHFFPTLSAVVGFWATMCLNISDFSRFSRTQQDQVNGQVVGLTVFMTLFSVIAVLVTSVAAGLITEGTLSRVIDVGDPVALLGSSLFNPTTKIVASFGLVVATLSTNIAANIVAPANAFVAILGGGDEEEKKSKKNGFKNAAFLVAFLGTLIAPWRLLTDPNSFIWVWLVGHAALLAPVTGVYLFDYHVVKRRKLNVDALYDQSEESEYSGVNKSAAYAFLVGVFFCAPGFLDACGVKLFDAGVVTEFIKSAYQHAWFVGFLTSGVAHVALSRLFEKRKEG